MEHPINSIAQWYPECIEEMMSLGVSLDADPKNGEENVLHCLMKNEIEESGRHLGFLMRNGAQKYINIPDMNGNSPLHIAAEKGDISGVGVMLLNGGDVNIQFLDSDYGLGIFYAGNTPLHEAMTNRNVYTRQGKMSEEQSLKMTGLLCEAGADIERQNIHGWTPLTMAARYCPHAKVIAYLCARGANPNHNKGDFPRGAKKYLVTPPLHLAAEFNSIDVIDALIEGGADGELISQCGESALCGLAARSPKSGNLNFYACAVELLKGAGADIEAPDRYGNSPLMTSVSRKNNKAAQAFLLHGADPNAANKHGENALTQAARSENWEGVKLLVAAGAEPPNAKVRKTVKKRYIVGGNEDARNAMEGEMLKDIAEKGSENER